MKMPCVDSHTVSRPPSHSATAPCGSSAVCSATGVRYSRVIVTSAARRPASTSPRWITRGERGETLPRDRSFGAPSARAWSAVTAWGAGSIESRTRSAAARAAANVSAHTTHSGCPA
jgi:hypothetical protein